MKKTAYSIQMSFEVPDSERRIAEKAEELFETVISKLKLAVEYLDYFYVPFKNVQDIDNEQIVEHRVIIRKYRDEVKNKFDKIMKKAFRCMVLMGEFASDTATEEMMKSFMDAMKDLEKQVNVFLSIFSNLDSPDFSRDMIASIDAVRKEVNKVRQLINDRILEHIDTNILAKNWMNDLSDRYQETVQQKLPMVVELFKERQQALKGEPA